MASTQTGSSPMKGGNGEYSYAQNSSFQRQGVEAAKVLINEAIAEKLDLKQVISSKLFTIADLGRSTGPNTIIAVENIIEAVKLKDSDGTLIGACSKKLRFPLGAVEVEAKAIEFRLQFAKDLLIQDFILEGDSLVVFNALSEMSSLPSSIAAVIYGFVSASHEFRQVNFSHVRRQGNCLAHLLAKHALGIDDFSVWLEEIPCFLEQALLKDVM
ncbi:hypothetical protein SO802_002464 [Lithocarpus litseifolius]|uniref:RNase H type-1 domain-containing protein n=1 Tax=Lithocarpus litseifolius TaxID=425828 RepID=A0AAW2E1B7_9ROSI